MNENIIAVIPSYKNIKDLDIYMNLWKSLLNNLYLKEKLKESNFYIYFYTKRRN